MRITKNTIFFWGVGEKERVRRGRVKEQDKLHLSSTCRYVGTGRRWTVSCRCHKLLLAFSPLSSTHLPASSTPHTCQQSPINSLYINPGSPDDRHQIVTDPERFVSSCGLSASSEEQFSPTLLTSVSLFLSSMLLSPYVRTPSDPYRFPLFSCLSRILNKHLCSK